MSEQDIKIALSNKQPDSLLSLKKWQIKNTQAVIKNNPSEHTPNPTTSVFIAYQQDIATKKSLEIETIDPNNLNISNNKINVSRFRFSGIDEFQNEARIFFNILFLLKYGLDYNKSDFYELKVHLLESDDASIKNLSTLKNRVDKKRELIDLELSKPEYLFTREYLKKYGKASNTPIPNEIKNNIKKFGVTYVYYITCLVSDPSYTEKNKIDYQSHYNSYIATLFDYVFESDSEKEQKKILQHGETYNDTIKEVTTLINFTLYNAVRGLGECSSTDCIKEKVVDINRILQDISTFFYPHKIPFSKADSKNLIDKIRQFIKKIKDVEVIE